MTTGPNPGSVSSEDDARTVNNGVRHQYRVLTDAEKEQMVRIKDRAADLIAELDTMPPQPEVTIARRKVQEASFWAVHALTA